MALRLPELVLVGRESWVLTWEREEGGPEARRGCLGIWLLVLALFAPRSFLRANVCFAPFVLPEGVRPCRPQVVVKDGIHLE